MVLSVGRGGVDRNQEDTPCDCLGNPNEVLPIVSIVVPFWGLPFRILNIELVKPKKGTAMETIGRV